MEVVLALVGLFGGFALSFCLWYAISHVLVPDLRFEPISALTDEPSGRVVYRLTFRNAGRRDVIDLSLSARIHLPRFSLSKGPSYATTSAAIVDVPIYRSHAFLLRAGAKTTMWLNVHEVDKELLEVLEKPLRATVSARREGSLEGILALRDDSYLLIHALAYDRFSGARKYFCSSKYTREGIVDAATRRSQPRPAAT